MNKNKIVIVTGAARGIGRGISLMLAENNCTVIAVGTKDGAPEFMQELTARSPESIYIKADISSGADCDNLVREAGRRFGNIDFHVNNAGIAPAVRADILETTPESFDRLIGVNLKGTFFLTQKIASLMIKNAGHGGAPRGIINISSVSAYTASANRAEYCISKAGVSMITALFADRLAEYNINVYEIRPGIIQTDMTAGVLDKYNRLIAEGLLPIARLGQPEDVAKAVLAVVSGLLPYSTGEIINADGGFHIRRL